MPAFQNLDPILQHHLAFPIYHGDLTLIIGDPGAGKSLLALDLAARAATGAPSPPTPANTPLPAPPDRYENDRTFFPGDVVFLSAEDPHLRDDAITHFRIPEERLPTPPIEDQSAIPLRTALYRKNAPFDNDSPLLSWLRRHTFNNLRLLILDPFPAFIGSHATSAFTLRQRIQKLLDFAYQRRFAILGISHIIKSHRAADPVHLALGTTGFTILARSILYLTRDPHPLSTQSSALSTPCSRRLLIPIKNNHAPINRAYAFSFRDRSRDPADLSRHIPPQLIWEPEPITNHPLLRDVRYDPGSSPALDEDAVIRQSQLQLAREFLLHTLRDGPIPSATLYKSAAQLGLPRRTIERARFQLHIRAERAPDHWRFTLPQSA